MPSNSDSKFNQFIYGLTTPGRVLALAISHPKLIVLSAFPIFITLLVVAISIYGILIGALGFFKQNLFHWMGSYSNFAGGMAAFILVAIALYFALQTITLLMALCSSPFNDLIAEATEEATGQVRIQQSVSTFIRVFFLDLRKTALSIGFVILLSILSFVPLVGVFSFLGFALVQTFTFVTYPQSRRRHGIRESLSWIRQNWVTSLGFGLASLLIFGIPVLNLFAIPIAVIGGTLIFLKK